jgi:hypothetical protein
MGARKLQQFLGIAPRTTPELLPDSAAQIAVNCKIYSGDLIPYRSPAEIENIIRTGEVKTIYPLINPAGGAKKWLSWLADVDVAVASSTNDDEQRIYYTGDGPPKVTNYELAVSGGGPYPVDAYNLGLPLPTVDPVATASAISALTISNVSRDANNVATFTTSAAHGLRSGQFITVSGFSRLNATYTSDATNDDITVTFSTVDFYVGSEVYLTIKTGSATSGYYTIKSVTSTTFTVSAPGVAASSGNVEVDMRAFNVVDAEITVVSTTKFSVSSTGPRLDESTGTFATDYGSGITAQLAGSQLPRTYVYTWLTPWGEESVPSDPANTVYVREGQTVTVSSLPTAKPTGDNFVRGFRLYRTVTDTTGSTYFLLRTVWFQNTMTQASRASNIVTATFQHHHNLEVGDKIKITSVAFGGVPDTSFNVTDVTVASVVDDYTITYTAAGSNKALTATTAGTLSYDIAEAGSSTSRYYESSSFTDDYDVGGLALELRSLEYEPPDEDMVGLCVMANNIMVGFVGNELCFSEPSKPWAWPSAYRLVFDSNIVAVEPISGSLLVLTDTYPYIVEGSTPQSMSYARIDVYMPCTSKRSVLNMGYGVVFATHQGLGVYSPSIGADAVTKLIHEWDTWSETLDSTTITAAFYEGKYFGSHSAGSFLFERNDQVGGMFVTTPIRFYSAYNDTVSNRFYFMADTNGQLSEWDAVGQPFLSLEWKSKVFVDPAYFSVGAFRVVADYGDVDDENTALLTYNAGVPAYNSAYWGVLADLGSMNTGLRYTDATTSAVIDLDGSVNSWEINGDPVTRYLRSTVGILAVNFRLWATKELLHDVTIQTSEIYRLPAAYMTDTVEVSVSGAIRVRSIHFGETPAGLRNI